MQETLATTIVSRRESSALVAASRNRSISSIIEVADEIFDCVARKELFELGVKLGRERLVVRNDKRRLVQLMDHVRDGKSFSRTSDTEQRLMAIAGLERLQEFGNRLSLIPARPVIRF